MTGPGAKPRSLALIIIHKTRALLHCLSHCPHGALSLAPLQCARRGPRTGKACTAAAAALGFLRAPLRRHRPHTKPRQPWHNRWHTDRVGVRWQRGMGTRAPGPRRLGCWARTRCPLHLRCLLLDLTAVRVCIHTGTLRRSGLANAGTATWGPDGRVDTLRPCADACICLDQGSPPQSQLSITEPGAHRMLRGPLRLCRR